MAFDDGVVEILNRNHHILSGKKVLICGNVSSLAILSQVKDLERCYMLLDNYDTAKSLAAMVGCKLGASEFETVSKKHLTIINAAPYDERVAQAITEDIDVVVLLLSKVKSLNQAYLHAISSKVNANSLLLLVGQNALGGKSADSLIKSVATVNKIDSARKCSVFLGKLKENRTLKDLAAPKLLKNVSYGGLSFIQNHGLFSQGELDKGTELLLDAVHADLTNKAAPYTSLKDIDLGTLESLEHVKNVLDLGCGSGIIALSLKKRGAKNVVAVDINPIALYSTKQNAKAMQLELKTLACNMLPSAQELESANISIDQGKFNYIVTNPPFHDGNQKTLAPTENMIAKAKDSLVSGGVLYLVGNTCLHYEEDLNNAFKRVEILYKSPKFTVFKAINE